MYWLRAVNQFACIPWCRVSERRGGGRAGQARLTPGGLTESEHSDRIRFPLSSRSRSAGARPSRVGRLGKRFDFRDAGNSAFPPAIRSIIMSQLLLTSVDHPEVSPLPISVRLRSQLVYFMTPPDSPGVPALGEREYWIARADVTRCLMEGVFLLVSPLDTEHMTEVELTEEQEALLSWLDKSHIQHVRVIE
jgi:hypothetical protein